MGPECIRRVAVRGDEPAPVDACRAALADEAVDTDGGQPVAHMTFPLLRRLDDFLDESREFDGNIFDDKLDQDEIKLQLRIKAESNGKKKTNRKKAKSTSSIR